MSTLDWIFVAVLLFSVGLGAWRGLVQEVAAILGWVLAYLLARAVAQSLGDWLPLGGLGSGARYVAGFGVAFLAGLLLSGLCGLVLSQMLSVAGLGLVNRLLGALFGAVRGAALLMLLTLLVGLTPWHAESQWREAHGVRWAQAGLRMVAPLLPSEFGKYLSTS